MSTNRRCLHALNLSKFSTSTQNILADCYLQTTNYSQLRVRHHRQRYQSGLWVPCPPHPPNDGPSLSAAVLWVHLLSWRIRWDRTQPDECRPKAVDSINRLLKYFYERLYDPEYFGIIS